MQITGYALNGFVRNDFGDFHINVNSGTFPASSQPRPHNFHKQVLEILMQIQLAVVQPNFDRP